MKPTTKRRARGRIPRKATSVKEAPRVSDRELQFLLDQGVIIIPCKPQEKVPAIPWKKYCDGDYNAEEILSKAPKDCNWAVLCGEPRAKLVVLDCEDASLFPQFQKLFGDIPAPIHTTPKGFHVIYRWPEGIPLPKKPRYPIPEEILPRTELLVHHCLALIPPSVVNGKAYSWISYPTDWMFPPYPLPEKLLRAVLAHEAEGSRSNRQHYTERDNRQHYTSTRTMLSVVPEIMLSVAPEEPPVLTAGAIPLKLLLGSNERLADYVMQKLGSSYAGPFVKCSCPLHPPDNKPSAAWLRLPNGLLMLYCFHDRLSLTIAELYAYALTGRLKRLSLYDQFAFLRFAAGEAGILEEELGKVEAAHRKALELIGIPWLQEWWEVLWRLAISEIERGNLNFLAPVRKMADLIGTDYRRACRIVNLLCVLGLFVKIGSASRGAQRLEVAYIEPQEALRRWNELKLTRLSHVSRHYVEARLGKEIAVAVFRRNKGKDSPATGAFESSQTEGREEVVDGESAEGCGEGH